MQRSLVTHKTEYSSSSSGSLQQYSRCNRRQGANEKRLFVDKKQRERKGEEGKGKTEGQRLNVKEEGCTEKRKTKEEEKTKER